MMKQKNKWMSWVALALMLVMMLAPMAAFAQAQPQPGDTFTLAKDDLSRTTFIDPLFGPISGGGQPSPLTGLMLVFNGILLTVGGILVLYTILAGTLSTAHDGEMLGKRWSTLWVPIRTSLAAAAMMPVVSGGWCVAQVAVIWLAMQGAAMANVMWSKFVENGAALITTATYAPPSGLTSIRQAYTTMFVNASCVASNEGIREQAGGDAALMGRLAYESRVTQTSNVFRIDYGPTGFWRNLGAVADGTASSAECGTIALNEPTNKINESAPRGGSNTGSMLFDLNAEEIAKPIAAARRAEFIHAKQETERLAALLATGDLSQVDFGKSMDALLKRYSTNVSKVASETFSEHVNADFLDRMKQDGWVMAGAMYLQMSRAQDQITRSITNAPTVVLPRVEDSKTANFLSGDGPVSGASEEDKDIGAAVGMVNRYVSSAAGGVAGLGQDSTSNNPGWSTRFVNWFINEDSAIGVGTIDVNQNPVMMAKGLGEKMTATAWGALAAASVAGMFTIGGAGVGTAAIIAPIFMLFFSSLLVPGAILSTYLPLMPYIMWIMVVLAWAILLIEAVIAAPLWALVHLAPDGDGVVGRGGQGYMLVLSLVLRPALMILGLVAAFVLMKPIGFLVNSTFVGAFSVSVEPGPFSLTQTIAGCVIYCIVMIILVQRVFSLIHVVPDRLLRWIGGGGGEIGEQAAAAGEGWGKAGAALGAHIAVGQVGQQAIGQMGAASRQNRQLAATRAAEDSERAASMSGAASTALRDAHVSGSKADHNQDAHSGLAAAAAFENHANVSYRAAQAEAKVDRSSDASSFSRGLARAEREGPSSARAYLEEQGKQAYEERQAYRGAKDRLGSGKEKPGDQQVIDAYSPQPYRELLASGYESQKIANEYYRKADGSELGGPGLGSGDSIRADKQGSRPVAPEGGVDSTDPNVDR